MNWRDKQVLVTGAGGFIGSHLVEKLVALGAQTRAIVQYRSNGSWGWLDTSPVKDQVKIIVGDVRDPESVSQAMRGSQVVFHLAALIGIPYSYQAPLSYVRTNVEGTMNVLQAARQFQVERVVHTSTSEVYGSARYVPIDEAHPLQGQSPYSASKIGADMMAQAFCQSFDLPVSIIRPFNTYGPRQSSRAIIPTIISQALTATSIRLGSLSPYRDFNYVQDTVEGFIKVAEASAAVGDSVNIGSGVEISVGELAKLILELVDKDLPILQDEQRIRPAGSEVQRLQADNRKAQNTIGWSPQYTLREGLGLTIEWIRENIEGYRAGSYAI
jgi:NAD dependent epimerase/dehydratase